MLGESYAEVLRRAAAAFEKAGVTWAVIGGATLPARGRIRATRDLDVLVHTAGKPPQGLIDNLRDAGFAHHPRADVHRLERVILYRFWFPVSPAASTGLDVQLSNDPYLDSVVERATPVVLAETRIPVATAEDLIVMKLLSFRPIDRADAIELVAGGGVIDHRYVQERSQELELEDRWRDVEEAARSEDDELPDD